MKKYQLDIPDSINNQIMEAHKQSSYSAKRPSQFIRHLITMGLAKYQTESNQEQKTQAPEMIQRTQSKIIPFPGVELNSETVKELFDFQIRLDNFLRETGYI